MESFVISTCAPKKPALSDAKVAVGSFEALSQMGWAAINLTHRGGLPLVSDGHAQVLAPPPTMED